MTRSFDRLLTKYEQGRLSRRELLAALAAVAVPAVAGGAQRQSGIQARSLQHVNLGVSDVARSEDFYRRLVGLPARRYIVGDAYALDFPDGGLISLCPTVGGNCSLTESDAVAGQIDHFGIGVENFDAERVATSLEAAGFESVRQAGSTSVLVPDPDGVVVQLSATGERFEGTPPDGRC